MSHLSVTYLSDRPDSPRSLRQHRCGASRVRSHCTKAWRQWPRALLLGLARAAQDRQATRATVDVDVPRRGEGGGAGRVARACSTAPDGSSTSIASASIADSRSSGTLLGEAFSATRAHTAHRHRNGGRPVLSAVRRKGAGAWRLAYLILCPCVACAHSASGGYTPLRTQWPQQQKARQGTGRGGAASVGDRTRPKPTTFGRKWTRPGRPDLELILRPSTPSCVVECCQSMCAGSRSSPPLEMRILAKYGVKSIEWGRMTDKLTDKRLINWPAL